MQWICTKTCLPAAEAGTVNLLPFRKEEHETLRSSYLPLITSWCIKNRELKATKTKTMFQKYCFFPTDQIAIYNPAIPSMLWHLPVLPTCKTGQV